jgi:hypothetical protein
LSSEKAINRKIDRNLDSRIFNLPNQLLNKTVSASVFLSKTLSLPASVRFANVPVNETVDFLANLANRAKLDERFDKDRLKIILSLIFEKSD